MGQVVEPCGVGLRGSSHLYLHMYDAALAVTQTSSVSLPLFLALNMPMSRAAGTDSSWSPWARQTVLAHHDDH